MEHDDKLTALERRMADLAGANAALEQRVADFEAANAALVQGAAELEQVVADLRELHAPELAELRAQRAAATPEAQARQAAVEARNRERHDALAYLAHHETAVRFPLGALRDVLKVARAVMDSDAAPVRRVLPGLEQSNRTGADADEARELA